jgi:hypothetical protein
MNTENEELDLVEWIFNDVQFKCNLDGSAVWYFDKKLITGDKIGDSGDWVYCCNNVADLYKENRCHFKKAQKFAIRKSKIRKYKNKS